MNAALLLEQKYIDADRDLKALVIWQVRVDKKHPEGFRYRLAFIPRGRRQPAVLYDNHHPKGHHKHIEGMEIPYAFIDPVQLIEDFEKDVTLWKARRSDFDEYSDRWH